MAVVAVVVPTNESFSEREEEGQGVVSLWGRVIVDYDARWVCLMHIYVLLIIKECVSLLVAK